MAYATVKRPMTQEDCEEKTTQIISLIEKRCELATFINGEQVFSNLVEPMSAWIQMSHEEQLRWKKEIRDTYSYRCPYRNSLKFRESSFGFENDAFEIGENREVFLSFPRLEVGKYNSNIEDGLDWCFLGNRAIREMKAHALADFVDMDKLGRHEVKPFDVKKDFPLLYKQIVDLFLPMAKYNDDILRLEDEIKSQIDGRTTKQVIDTWEESKAFIYANYNYEGDEEEKMIAPYSQLVSQCGINLLTAQ